MLRPTCVRLDVAALKNNLRLLKRWNGDDFFCPMIKANAYGHGDIQVARVIEEEGASAVGVALVEEGLRLRTAGVRLPILVFASFDRDAASAMLTHHLTPVLTRLEDLEALASLKLKSPLGVHVKFNTGMGRLGFDGHEVERLRTELARQPALHVEGVCTHLAFGEEVTEAGSASQRQLQMFKQMSEGFPGLRHAHKSASLLAYAQSGRPKPPGIGSRPGLAMYGLPFSGVVPVKGLEPVLTWASALARVHVLEGGMGVGYGATWRAPRRSVIGVVPAGYGDGYLRALSNKGEMLFRGRAVPVVGSVCMDYIFVDLTEACADRPAAAGEEILLLGRSGTREVSAGHLAEKAGTIAYEIVTNISNRVAREGNGP